MILHFGYGGRLGNQLFALAYIESVRRPSERVVCTRMGSALSVIGRRPRYFSFDGRLTIFLVKKILRPLVEGCLVPLKIFSCRWERPDGSIRVASGILPLTYLRGNYQFGWVAARPRPFRIRRAFLDGAAEILTEAGSRTPLFVHIRRGDYLTFTVHEQVDPSLPASYYREAAQRLVSKVRDPFFFFLGDDPEWIVHELAHLPHADVTRRAAALDLALMSQCSGGVISNSTFAWWGAALCARTAPIIAPRFWLGWRSRSWYPPLIETREFTFIEAEPGGSRAGVGRGILKTGG